MTGLGRRAIDGVWIDPGEKGVKLLSHVCTASECLVSAQKGPGDDDGAPLLYRFQPGQSLQPFHPIQSPKSNSSWEELGAVELVVDIDRSGQQFSITLVESQGGSWGMYVFPQIGSPHREFIASTTDSDITFGQPHILRGDELFTLEFPGGAGSLLWQFRRVSGQWSPTQVPMPEGRETHFDWDLALSDDANLLFCVSEDAGNRVERFVRGANGVFRHDGHIQLPAKASLVGFAGLTNEMLLVVFAAPQPDGASAWLLDPRSGAIRQSLTFPGMNVGVEAVQGNKLLVSWQPLDIDRLLMSAEWAHRRTLAPTMGTREWKRSLHLVSLVVGAPICELALETPDTFPKAKFMGHYAVVMCNNRMGSYDLQQCPQ